MQGQKCVKLQEKLAKNFASLLALLVNNEVIYTIFTDNKLSRKFCLMQRHFKIKRVKKRNNVRSKFKQIYFQEIKILFD